MSLFDFLRSKQKQPQSFDALFDLASNDVAYEPLFYRTLLEIELYVLIYQNENLPEGKFVTDKNLTLQVKMFSDGTIPVFTSKDKIYDNSIIKEQVRYIAMKGQELFDLFPNPPRILLNPYSRPSKELLPEEIVQLRTGQLYSREKTQTIKAGTQLQFDLPTNCPIGLADTLKKYAETRNEIKEVYLALLNNIESNKEPQLVIGVKADRDIKNIFREMSEVIKEYIPKDKFIDMIELTGNTSTTKSFKK